MCKILSKWDRVLLDLEKWSQAFCAILTCPNWLCLWQTDEKEGRNSLIPIPSRAVSDYKRWFQIRDPVEEVLVNAQLSLCQVKRLHFQSMQSRSAVSFTLAMQGFVVAYLQPGKKWAPLCTKKSSFGLMPPAKQASCSRAGLKRTGVEMVTALTALCFISLIAFLTEAWCLIPTMETCWKLMPMETSWCVHMALTSSEGECLLLTALFDLMWSVGHPLHKGLWRLPVLRLRKFKGPRSEAARSLYVRPVWMLSCTTCCKEPLLISRGHF